MKPVHLFAAMLLAAALLTDSTPAHAITVGEPAPLLTAPRADGQALSLEQLKGRVVYVDFWASWCAPCRQAMPEYERLWREFEPRGFTIVGVNIDTERRLAERALKQAQVTFPIVFDPKSIWPRKFDLPTMPTAYIVDRNGVVLHVHEGYREGDATKLRGLIEAALQEGR